MYGDFTDFLLSASDVALVCTLGCWLVAQTLQRRRVSIGPRFLAWPVAVLLGVAAVGVPFSVDPGLSVYTTIRCLLLVGLALYMINEVDSIRELVLPVSVMVVVQAVVGIGQVVGQRSLSLSRVGEHELLPRLGVSVVTISDGTRVLRAYGLADHPNILGGTMVFALLVLAGGIAVGRSHASSASPAAPSSLTLLVVALAAACALLTFSRGAWIAGVVGLVILLVLTVLGSQRHLLPAVGIVVAATALGVAPFLAPYHEVLSARADRSGTITTEARSVSEREALSRAAGRIIGDHPLLGVGIGTLPSAMKSAEPTFQYDYQPAASVLLDVTAETGVLGGTAYLVLLVAPWIALVRHRRSVTVELAAASAALAAVAIVGLVDYYPWSYATGRIWAWLILGLWIGAYRRAIVWGGDDV